MLDTYLDAAFAMAGMLNQIWGFYSTVIIAVLGGVILSPSLRPPQPVGRVALILVGLAAFFSMNFLAIAMNSARLNFLLEQAGTHAGDLAHRKIDVFKPPLDFIPMKDDPFAFDGTWPLFVHLAIDVFVLVALGWVLLGDGRRQAERT
jgi:hypothetical protein